MYPSRRIILPAAAAFLLLANPTVSWSRSVTPTKAIQPAGPYVSASRVVQVNTRADRLVRIDQTAMQQFDRQHPGVLPELKLLLPKVTALQFDWCNLNKVCEPRRQLNGDCWANAATEALECNYLIRNNRRLMLSSQPLLDFLKLGPGSEKEFSGKTAQALDDFAGLFAQSRNQEVAQRGLLLRQAAARLRQGDDGKKTGELAAAR